MHTGFDDRGYETVDEYSESWICWLHVGRKVDQSGVEVEEIMDNWIMANSKCRVCSNRQLVAADAGEQRGAAEEVEAVAAGNAGVLMGEAGGEA